ncbi:hypothetical protein KBQ09_07930 [Klebsiella pneumoniae]|uniref:hypothetical protein n=1 Tax=Klebsiella pneumoniae TaxID=573 RepID=UPI000E2C40CF|nr:hypothetical protein [Klebsiella pneumoniae]ELA2149458.1 hypothetical protein [Klebsiella pneumoniae]MCS6019617.1 hypothetical protein [Klebsiella pneumoniae subsp. pneumoniae]MCT2745133.1 hypothetical protein [Klebsiella pneumoniae]MCT2750819.1 hypothetical protein [Klebsiella pneumoniae]MCT2756449.1 hypothetical protein [Klebsiella pneumoniae]
MNIETVNDLIASLESAGDLSIREQKLLKLAKEFRICSASLDAAIKTGNVLADKNSQLAAENVALRATSDDRRMFIMNGVQLGYIKVPTVETDPALETIRIAVSPQDPTPATDRIVAGIKADGVEEFSKTLEGAADICGKSKAWEAQENLLDFASRGFEFAKQLRDGGSHD